ncbi:MAG: class C sortase [Lachnospiraceae bacterium]|nr:class C sortase [Lachnospiraceae bacterium]
MDKKKKNVRGYQLRRVFSSLVILAGVLVLLYPTFSNVWNEYRNSLLRSDYSAAVENLNTEEYDEVLRLAREYNDQHTVNTVEHVFEEDENYLLSHPYDELLNPSGNGIMGTLRIPKIYVNLPIYHGLGTQALEEGCGHVEGTSLPIGGTGTHSALAAHRGLPTAKLFTDLDQIEIGDLFYITVLDETLAYEVDQIEVVEPSEVELLAIDPEEDYVTLITCTPYGVNSHRLLIRGTRTEYIEEEAPQTSFVEEVIGANFYLRVLLIALLILAAYMILSSLYRKKRGSE